ncbi:MAG: ribonuclease R [Candidatus Reconcilbacillus cellulovorans]|uniref:Ribonuclease R n=1 Tax=Candidatus Reconcilbacillus cellulovorans TaxID=1906605 RepID=A0A2A6E322_9BACL|nr:MAG: ribonuclease R [Candidatus Reconcilbacillus cellulovorans]
MTERELLEFMRERAYRPMTADELALHFGCGAEDGGELARLLHELEARGDIYRTRAGRYGVPERMNMARGVLQITSKGFGFVTPDGGGAEVFVHAGDLNGAMHGDRVMVRLLKRGFADGRPEGQVVRVLERKHDRLVGTFRKFDGYGFVIPDERRLGIDDVFVPQASNGGAEDGHKVVVRIVDYPDRRRTARGEVVEILGRRDDPGVDVLAVVRKYRLPEAFSEEAMAEAEAVPDAVSPEELVGRRDLRDKPIVTIDGEDAKDLDDAVCVERLPEGGYRLYVSIADVSYYVREDSALDREAYERGCSVYLADRVIPMLPPRLSNGICSLNPAVDRLTLTCEMAFDADGRRVGYELYPSVIRSRRRATYTDVRKILVDRDAETTARYAELADEFRLMEELALKLRERRMRRGAIDFDIAEAKIVVDEQGRTVDVVQRERTIAERIIEEFMLAANETVAEHIFWMKIPFIYRVHEEPDPEKMRLFAQFVANFGYTVRGKAGSVHPRALQAILEQIRGTKEENLISTVLLRSMKLARYEAESLGHFGLAAEFYTHFTSPIRRYPDLIVHRIVREVLRFGSLPPERLERWAERLPDIAAQSSERERVAVDAEREVEKMKKAEFMKDKIGEEFDGIISGVTSFGMFVELSNTVEGLVRLSSLADDYYHYHETHHALIGERTGRVFRIGDEVRVRVVRVDAEEYTVDFELVDTRPRRGRSGRENEGRKKSAGSAGGRGRGSGLARKGHGRAKNEREERTDRDGRGGSGRVGRRSGGKSRRRK